MIVHAQSNPVPFGSHVDILPSRARGGALEKRFHHNDVFDDVFGSSVQHWLEVPLDYSGKYSNSTFSIRYHINDSVFDANSGPIFLSMGGEGTASSARCSTLALQHKALCVQVEHRFYGESFPADGSTLDNLAMGLYTENNLADTARVVEDVWKMHGKRSVIAFGGSYSGATCSWFRALYPDHTKGCISESGVINPILDFSDFDVDINEASGTPDHACAQRLRLSTRAMERLAASDFDTLKRIFNASNLIGTPHGDTDFFYMVADGPAMMVQYGSKKELCQGLASVSDTATDVQVATNLADLIAYHYGPTFGSQCFYDSECIKQPVPPSGSPSSLGGSNDRSWRWQKCGELAYLQTAPLDDSRVRAAALTLDALISQCEYVFGSHNPIQHNKKWLEFTGGQNILNGKGWKKTVSNIHFINYSDDPWKYAGAPLDHDLSPELPTCYLKCNGCGHCGAGVPFGPNKCSVQSAKLVARWIKE